MLQRNSLVLYRDSDFKHSFIIQDLGMVEPGEILKKKGYLSNNSQSRIENITYEAKDSDISLVGIPSHLKAGEWEEVTILFSPPVDRTDSLNSSVTINGTIIGGDNV